MKKILVSLCLIMVSLVAVAADKTYSFSGRVVDKGSDVPMVGVAVFFPELKRGAVTDDEGYFEIHTLPARSLVVEVSLMGYQRVIKKISPHLEAEVIFHLVEATTNVEEIVVSGAYVMSRESSPIVISKMDKEEILRYPAPSLMTALTRTAGVDEVSMGPGISKPVIRGMSFSRVLTVYQGARFENQQLGADHGLCLAETGISGVEVIKGPASLMYGSGAMAGVVNLLEEKDAQVGSIEGDVNLRGFSNSLGSRIDAGARGTSPDGLTWSLRAATESHADYLDGEGQAVGNTRFNTQNIKGSVGMHKNWGNTKIRYTYLKQNLGILEEDELQELVTHRNDRAMQLPFQDVTDHFLSSETNVFLGKDQLKVTLGYHLNYREEIEDAFDEVDLGLRQRNFMYDLKYYKGLNPDLELIVGVQGFLLHNQNFEHAEEILIPDASKDDRSFYALLNYSKDKWVLQGGARYDYRKVIADARAQKFLDYGFELPGAPEERYMERDFGGFTASGGATFRPSDRWRLRANAATGFRAPDLAELFSNGPHPGTSRFELGNASFQREQNFQGDLGIRYSLPKFSIGAEAFYNHVDNFIFFAPTDIQQGELTVWAFEQDNARLYGGEAFLDFNPGKFVHLHSSYSMVIGQKRTDNSYLPYIPAFRWVQEVSLRPAIDFGRITNPYLSMRGNWVMDQQRAAPLEQATPGYFLLNLSVGSQVAIGQQNVEIFLSGTNLLNKTYMDHMSLYRPFGINQMGRNVALHLRLSF